MAVYTVRQKYLVDNYAVLNLLTSPEIEIGLPIDVADVDATFDGTFVVIALPPYLFVGVSDEGDLLYNPALPIANQVLYAKTAANVDRVAASGTVTYAPVATWVDSADVLTWLGISSATQEDEDFTTTCAEAASQFAYRRRYEAGYTDSLTTVPSQDVFLGCQMLGGAYYRQRGSVDSYASFQDMGAPPVPGLNGMIKQLLGIGRPAVA